MPITFFKDCKEYYNHNDAYIGGQGKFIGGLVGTIIGTVYGAGVGQFLETCGVDGGAGSYLVTEITSSVGFLMGIFAFKYLTKPISLTLAILEAGFDRVVKVLDALIEFKEPYTKCNEFFEDKNAAEEHRISRKTMVQALSACVGAYVGPAFFSQVGQFVAPNLVISTDSNGRQTTAESIGQRYGQIAGPILGLIAVTPLHRTLSFSGAFTYSLCRTLFWKPVKFIYDRCCPADNKDEMIGPINGDRLENNYVPPLPQDVMIKPDSPKSLSELKAKKKELKKQIRELESKEQGKQKRQSKKSQNPSENSEVSTGAQANQMQVRIS